MHLVNNLRQSVPRPILSVLYVVLLYIVVSVVLNKIGYEGYERKGKTQLTTAKSKPKYADAGRFNRFRKDIVKQLEHTNDVYNHHMKNNHKGEKHREMKFVVR